jgi:hypothetical protein
MQQLFRISDNVATRVSSRALIFRWLRRASRAQGQ